MGMSADDSAETRRSRIKVEFAEIMKDIEHHIVDFNNLCFMETSGPFAPVDISPHGNDRGNSSQCLEHLGLPNVPCMND